MNTLISKDNQQGITRDINQKGYLFWLGGFYEGEGSASVSISISSTFKFGVQLQPTFNVSGDPASLGTPRVTHENGLPILQSFKDLFGSGYLVKKSGSDLVWVYTLKGYKNMIEKVIPFVDTYVSPFSCKRHEYEVFKEISLRLNSQEHLTQEGLIKLVELAYFIYSAP
jgi:hypothetical protein